MPTKSARLIGLFAFLFLQLPTHADEVPRVPPDHARRMKQGLDLFRKHVRPVLVEQCLRCHGGDKTRGDFDLATREALLQSPIIGKEVKVSRLIAILKHTEEPYMPKSKDRLPDAVIARIGEWLELGAPYDKPLVDKTVQQPAKGITEEDRNFWSFRPLNTVEPPQVSDPAWNRQPIDRFIHDALSKRGLKPNPSLRDTDRRLLIRRATFDLIGLPPTPEEVDAFVNDPDPLAYEKLIDRLLGSPQYGERWARHWMDVARFAESHGYEQDYDRPHAYHYRDFLIKALNRDMPYDQFVRWQLAGDELAPDDPLAMTATGFLGGGAFPTQLTEAEFESARYDELDDMTATTGVAFLGLSIGCARCHDHKFDPIPTVDYYRLASAFTTTIRSEIDLVLEAGGKPVKVMVASEGLPKMKHHADGRGFPHFYPTMYVLERGDVHQKKEEATLSFPRVLMRNGKATEHWQVAPPPDWKRTSFRRASLANWITDIQHGAGHLLARVIVNRLWHHHFGRGIVATPSDFGLQGERPTHPELLDWLAGDLIKNGWRLKHLHRAIMLSNTYTQNSDWDSKRATLDPENVYYWRHTPMRLEAEAIRDSLLHVGGMLDETMYGPGTLDPNMRRRSVYFFIKRSSLIPMMMLFDWPEHLVSIGRRATTTIAPQALAFLNSPQCRQYAEGFAKRLDGPGEEAINRAYRIAYGRHPTDREVALAKRFLDQQTARYQAEGKANAAHLARVDFCQALMCTNEFVYVE